jgi:8-oxo-dGTP pyrophosphatase MutT (NUDIX family)
MFTPHVTVASVIEHNGRFLMVEELIEGKTLYNQPAGHLEEQETLIQAAARETLEETGWRVSIDHYLGVQVFRAANEHTYVRHNFAGHVLEHYPNRTLDTGIVAAHWLDLPAIRALESLLRSPMIVATIEQYLAGDLYPLAMVR